MAGFRLGDERFINPYSFVSLGEGPVRRSITEWRGKLSGRIRCSLTIETPLAIPEVAAGEGTKAKPYPFFRVAGEPLIPGSELRGCIRSVFEAATDSCLSVFDDEVLNGRSARPKRKAGLLYRENGVWKLQEAECYAVNTFIPVNTQPSGQPALYQIGTDAGGAYITVAGRRCRTGSEVWLDRSNRQYITSSNNNTGMYFAQRLYTTGSPEQEHGYLLLGEWGLTRNRRHNSHVMVPRGSIHDLPKGTATNLQAVLDCYRDPSLDIAFRQGRHLGYKGYELPKVDRQYLPVFYETIDCGDGSKAYYLAPSIYSREVYYRRLHEITGSYTPCTGDKGCLCHACSVFGMVGRDAAYGSVLRFTDGRPEGTITMSEQAVLLKELSTPKITSSEFYLKDPGADIDTWNTDYCVYWVNNRQEAQRRSVTIRGRKFYLHHGSFSLSDATDRQQTDRNACMELAESGSFRFDVYFDGITEETLNALLWSLQPTASGKELRHKLGHGRPLGLGSVQIRIKEVETRSFSVEKLGELLSRREEEVGSIAAEELPYRIDRWDKKTLADRLSSYSEKVSADLTAILDRGLTTEKSVRYPVGIDATRNPNTRSTYLWFVGNRQINTTGTRPKVMFTLPRITDSDITLPAMVKQQGHSVRTTGNRGGAQGNTGGQQTGSNNVSGARGTAAAPTVGHAGSGTVAQGTIKRIQYKNGQPNAAFLDLDVNNATAEGFMYLDGRALSIGDRLTVTIREWDRQRENYKVRFVRKN